jgi:hypothetical protein
VNVTASDHRPEPEDEREKPPRHPSYDPSGNEPAGSSTGIPEHDLADTRFAEAERDAPPKRPAPRGTTYEREDA